MVVTMAEVAGITEVGMADIKLMALDTIMVSGAFLLGAILEDAYMADNFIILAAGAFVVCLIFVIGSILASIFNWD